MRYHLLSPEDREDLGESSRPRRKKHDYRIALFGGSQPQSCRYFNPKVLGRTERLQVLFQQLMQLEPYIAINYSVDCVNYFWRSTQDSTWTDIRCPFEKRRDATVVFWDNVVYILGGSQLFPIKRMDCYNVLKDSWYSRLGPPAPRDSLAACAAQGKIYTSGGSEVGEYRERQLWIWDFGDLSNIRSYILISCRKIKKWCYFLYAFLQAAPL